MSNKIHWQ